MEIVVKDGGVAGIVGTKAKHNEINSKAWHMSVPTWDKIEIEIPRER